MDHSLGFISTKLLGYKWLSMIVHKHKYNGAAHVTCADLGNLWYFYAVFLVLEWVQRNINKFASISVHRKLKVQDDQLIIEVDQFVTLERITDQSFLCIFHFYCQNTLLI